MTRCPSSSAGDDEKELEAGMSNDEAESTPVSSSDASGLDMGWPEEAGRAPLPVLSYRRWTFSYMGKILRKGSRQVLADGTHLKQEDLYRVPAVMETSYLMDKFHSVYAEEERHLTRTLWRLAAPTFIPAGFCQLLTVIAQLSIPVLVREVLAILEESPHQSIVKKSLGFVVLIFVASVANALATHRQRHLAMKSGIVIRAAVVGGVYRHALSLTPTGRSGLTTGEVTNLVAVDAQKLFEVMQEGHLIWSCPLSMILVAILLLIIMGPTTLVGIAVLFAFVPLTERITRKMIVIRKKRIHVGDQRVEIINAMLQGIKVTKLNNYESRYVKRISDTRERELKFLRRELRIWALTLSITVITPVLASAATFVTYVLVDENNILTASKTFTTLLLFSALRFPINYGGRLLGKLAQAYEAARRISGYMARETRKDENNQSSQERISIVLEKYAMEQPIKSMGPVLEVKDGTFHIGGPGICASATNDWTALASGQPNGGFSLKNVNFSVGRSEILAVVGPVGCGKSVLMNSIIGEVSSSPDTVITYEGSVAYSSQIPFILNATLRENILFGSPYDEARYEKVLDACCLREDIEHLGESRDMTEIGERGITLSGGQKQRVSLARVVYSKPDLAILDDPLSALDAGTSRKIFEQVLKSPDNDLLGSSAIVLVTHASHFLHRVDKIMILVDGLTSFLGSWNELATFESSDPAAKTAIDSIRNAVQEKAVDEDESLGAERNDKTHIEMSTGKSLDVAKITESDAAESGVLMSVEEREHGLSSYRTWFLWFRHAGGFMFIAVLFVALVLDRFAYVVTEWWLARWTQGADGPIQVFGIEFPAQTDGVSAQYEYLKVYATILLISFTAASQRSLWAVSGGARCSRSLFALMTERVLRAPLSFFETTPLGRILNRFTYDVEVLDLMLTENMSVLLIAASWFVASVCVMTIILPWIFLALVPVTFLYLILQTHYRKSGTDLQRLDAVSRSPIQAMLAEGLDGAATIRVFKQEDNFLHKFQSSTNANTSAQLNFITAQRWIGVRTELLGALIVFVSTLLIVIFNTIDAGFAAMLIIWASNFNITLGFLVDHASEAEAAITSIERINAMSMLPQEKSMETEESKKVPKSWPSRGKLEFKDVCLRYRRGLPLALNGLSFTVEPGKRCGVVGRTGAGKTSLTAALFRLVECESGRVLLDGIDLSTLGLSDVRGRPNGMAIIPQDPVLFAGTLRECLDPFGGSTDEEILEALLCIRLSGVESGLKILDAPVDEGGANFSVGERQLLCLARAMLTKPNLLVLDEATASVDAETDAFVQRVLRTQFKNTTLLTIAHRLNTIIDYDCIIVMADGKVIEFGSPKELLTMENGVFTDLVNSTGKESAAVLRATAKSSSTNE